MDGFEMEKSAEFRQPFCLIYRIYNGLFYDFVLEIFFIDLFKL